MPETMLWPPSEAEDLRLKQDEVEVLRQWRPTIVMKCLGRQIGTVKIDRADPNRHLRPIEAAT